MNKIIIEVSVGELLDKISILEIKQDKIKDLDNANNKRIKISKYYIENISNPDDSERFYSIVGYICETDTFATNRRISMISEGDILCFKNAGAYCFSMASNYNSRYKPSEILFYNNEFTEIRKRESFEDLINLSNSFRFPFS